MSRSSSSAFSLKTLPRRAWPACALMAAAAVLLTTACAAVDPDWDYGQKSRSYNDQFSDFAVETVDGLKRLERNTDRAVQTMGHKAADWQREISEQISPSANDGPGGRPGRPK